MSNEAHPELCYVPIRILTKDTSLASWDVFEAIAEVVGESDMEGHRRRGVSQIFIDRALRGIYDMREGVSFEWAFNLAENFAVEVNNPKEGLSVSPYSQIYLLDSTGILGAMVLSRNLWIRTHS